MKPVITWIVLANARAMRVLLHQGPGKGLTALTDKNWQAPQISVPRDKAGVGHSIAGPGIAAVDESDPKRVNDQRFAKDVMADISEDCIAKSFDRLILICGPYMLGLLRAELDGPLRAALVGEIPKDLSAQPLDQIAIHLGELIAV